MHVTLLLLVTFSLPAKCSVRMNPDYHFSGVDMREYQRYGRRRGCVNPDIDYGVGNLENINLI